MCSVLGEIYFHKQSMCGSMNAITSHNLIRSGTIKRYDIFGVGMALQNKVCHCGGGL